MPKIIVDNELIADMPDETGDYFTLDGRPIRVNTDYIGRRRRVQRLGVQCELFKGRPGSSTENGVVLIELSPGRGRGSKTLTGGIELKAQLQCVPIKKSSLSQPTYPWRIELEPHPRWRRGPEL